MNCIEPPALDELELSQFADGEAEQTTITHVAACPFCRANAEQRINEQQSLKSLLFRSTCPPPEELRDFQMSFLDRVRDNFVALHVTTCPHCAREISLLGTFLDDPLLHAADESPTVLQKLRVLVGELRISGTELGLAGLRGGDGAVQTYSAGSGQIGVEVQPDEANPEQMVLKGLLTGIELADLSVHLWRENQLVATAPVDDLLGDFVVAGLAPGAYELTLNGPDLVIRIPSLKIGG